MTDPDDAPDAHADEASDARDETWVERVEERTGKTLQEVITVIVLSLTAVLTAWCGFQSSKWGGEMSIAFSQASSARIQAANADGEARTARGYDLTIWATYVGAVAEDNTELADYVRERFTPAFKVAFEDWVAGGRAESGPFAMPSYVPPGTVQAEELSARADTKFQTALDNNARGDRYSLLTVLFALVLFFAAISGRDLAPWVSRTFLGIAIVLMVVGAVILSTFPVIV
jgi:hypothetical protein